jgi:hypothetical protein
MTTDPDDLARDLLWGAAEIAKELNLPLRKTIYLIDRKILPTGKVGGRLVASRKNYAPLSKTRSRDD